MAWNKDAWSLFCKSKNDKDGDIAGGDDDDDDDEEEEDKEVDKRSKRLLLLVPLLDDDAWGYGKIFHGQP